MYYYYYCKVIIIVDPVLYNYFYSTITKRTLCLRKYIENKIYESYGCVFLLWYMCPDALWQGKACCLVPTFPGVSEWNPLQDSQDSEHKTQYTHQHIAITNHYQTITSHQHITIIDHHHQTIMSSHDYHQSSSTHHTHYHITITNHQTIISHQHITLIDHH